MYCAHCGKELVEGANFCTACGSRSAVAERLAATAEDEAAEGTGDVASALASSRSRSRLRFSPAILIVLALALTAGVAMAAYYVYTEVYLPSIQNDSAELASNSGSDVSTDNYSAKETTYSFIYKSAIDGDAENRFLYPSIVCSTPNDVVDSLNAKLQEEAMNAAGNSIAADELWVSNEPPQNDFSSELRYYSFRQVVTFLENDTISIWTISEKTYPWNAHGRVESECATINLKTGEQLEPEKVLGLDKEALYEASFSVMNNSVALGIASEPDADIEESLSSAINKSGSKFFLIPNGIALSINQYEFSTILGIDSVVVYSRDPGTYKPGDVLSISNTTDNVKYLPQLAEALMSRV